MKCLKLLMLISLASVLQAQTVTTLGTDFWVTFMKAINTYTVPSLTLVIAGQNSCTGRVENPNTGWYEDFSVTEGTVTNIAIPLEQAYTTALGSPTNKGLHVTSTDTIAVFASNYQSAIFDISNVYPTAALMDDYLVQGYRGAYGLSCEFVVVGTEDNTVVKVTPTADCTSNNNIVTNLYANTAYNFTLNAGQSLMLKANSTADDLSGSRVKALNCKKVAVFTGTEGLQMPYGTAYVDLYFEQCVPTAYWGRHFVVTASMIRTADRIKVTSLRDSCQIRLDGIEQTTIMEGESYMFELTPDKPAVYMETTQPVCTYLYFTGGEYGGYSGDPSSTLINPIEQQIDDITFPTYNTDSTQYHFVNIIAETSKTQGITLDGEDISTQFNPVGGNTQYSYARVEISHGSHRLRSAAGGFVAHIYGLGPHESYSYSAGSSAVNLNKQMKVNDIVGIPDKEIRLCSLDTATFTIVADFDIDQVTWDFGDNSTANGINANHRFSNYGSYEVTAIIRRTESAPCSETLFDTVRNTIVIVQPESHHIATSCGPYEWNGVTYTESGDYEYHTTQTHSDCDSIAHLHLDVSESYDLNIVEISCRTSYFWNGTEYTQPGEYHASLTTDSGCDSLLTLHLSFTEESVDVAIEGELEPHGGDEINFTHYVYSVSTTPEATIDSVTWDVDCPNWSAVPQGNGEVCDLFIHTYIFDSVQLTATVYLDCGEFTTTIWLHTIGYGVDENKAPSVRILPNPNEGMTKIVLFDKDIAIRRLEIRNMLGATVLEVANPRSNSFDVSALPTGVYIVHVATTEGEVFIAKLVKK